MSTPWFRHGFRQAAPASASWNLAKTAAQIAVFWSVFLLFIPQVLVAMERRLGIGRFEFPALLAWAVFGLASVLGLVSGATMATAGAGTPLPVDAPRHLVVRGPYRYVRNPMAVAGLTQGACVACLLGSWSTMGLVAAGFIVWNFVVRPLEERDLATRFGDAYRAYRGEVRCWIPRFPGYPHRV